MQAISAVVSVIALCVSLFTFWFTILRRGTVRSTHPSFIAFSYDSVGKPYPQAKIFIRTLLYSTGKRGIVIESLFLRVREDKRFEEFSFWGYGDKDLVRGSGLFVGENGVATNHHFNPTVSEKFFQFNPGIYDLELVAKLVDRNSLVKLWKTTLELPSGAFEPILAVGENIEVVRGTMPVKHTAVYFNWSPGKNRYIASIETRPTQFLKPRLEDH
jgi:hypothetical protein